MDIQTCIDYLLIYTTVDCARFINVSNINCTKKDNYLFRLKFWNFRLQNQFNQSAAGYCAHTCIKPKFSWLKINRRCLTN